MVAMFEFQRIGNGQRLYVPADRISAVFGPERGRPELEMTLLVPGGTLFVVGNSIAFVKCLAAVRNGGIEQSWPPIRVPDDVSALVPGMDDRCLP